MKDRRIQRGGLYYQCSAGLQVIFWIHHKICYRDYNALFTDYQFQKTDKCFMISFRTMIRDRLLPKKKKKEELSNGPTTCYPRMYTYIIKDWCLEIWTRLLCNQKKNLYRKLQFFLSCSCLSQGAMATHSSTLDSGLFSAHFLSLSLW